MYPYQWNNGTTNFVQKSVYLKQWHSFCSFTIKHVIKHSNVSSVVHVNLSWDPLINTNCSLGLNVFIDYSSNHKGYTNLSPNGKTCISKGVLINEFGQPYCMFQNLIIQHLMFHQFPPFLPWVFSFFLLNLPITHL